MKARAIGFVPLIAGLTLSLASTNVVAETKAPAGDKVTTVKSEPAKSPIRMNDSQLDQIVAGGHTIIWQPSGGGQGTYTCFYVSGSGKINNKPCLL